MARYALLCGSAPDGFTQKKINEMYDFLTSSAGGFWREKDIMILPNGGDQKLLDFVLSRLVADGIEAVFLYICTEFPVAAADKSFWLCGEEIRKSTIEKYSALSDFQVIYDSDCNFVSDDYEDLPFSAVSTNDVL